MRIKDVQIRPAVKADCTQLMGLIRELALFEKAPDEVTVSMEEFENAGFGPNPVFIAFVASRDQTVIGFALCYVRYSTWKGRRLYLEDLLITEAERGNGIGSLLFDECIKETQRQRYDGMVWQVLDWNEPAINFYKKYKASFDGGWLNCVLSNSQVQGLILQQLLDIFKGETGAFKDAKPIELGLGVIDFPELMKALKEINYSGICSHEHEKDMTDLLPGLSESAGFFKGVMQTT